MDRIAQELEGNRIMANQIAQQVFSFEAKVIDVYCSAQANGRETSQKSAWLLFLFF